MCVNVQYNGNTTPRGFFLCGKKEKKKDCIVQFTSGEKQVNFTTNALNAAKKTSTNPHTVHFQKNNSVLLKKKKQQQQ